MIRHNRFMQGLIALMLIVAACLIGRAAFAAVAICSIGDRVWHDENRNGVQDEGEPGINGVTVLLKDSSGTVIATAVTAPFTFNGVTTEGYYKFKQPGGLDLCGGTFTVEIAPPEGFAPTVAGTGGNAALDSSNSPVTVTLGSSSDTTIDFGFMIPCGGRIGDFVWHDVNRDGIQDPDEPGIGGVTVRLLDSEGNPLAETTTEASGLYQFANLCAGSYQVQVNEQIQGDYRLTDPDMGDPSLDSNPIVSVVTLQDDNSSDPTIDFGYVSPYSPPACTASLGDYIWNDRNGNGLQDAGEPGMNGVRVVLAGDDGSFRETTTGTGPQGQGGYYQFTGLCPGEYTATVDPSTLPQGFVPTIQVLDSEGNPVKPDTDSNGSPATVHLEEGATDQSVDFGFLHPCTGEIGNFVWHDLNRNGIQDEGEPGINGVRVTLGDIENPSAPVASTTTADDPLTGKPGYYLFASLCAGTYGLAVDLATLPPEHTPTAKNASGSAVHNDSDGDGSGRSAQVVLTVESMSDLTVDFGFVTPAACTASIGDFAWHDMNHNGIQDAGEPGLGNVWVKLEDSEGWTKRTVRTGKDGKYLFGGLCAGSYAVKVVPPCGFQPTAANQGADPARDSDKNGVSVVLPQNGSSNLTIDFGFASPCTGRIGNFVWYDKEGNGLQNPSEQGIDGAVVNLRDSKGNLLATTTTGKASCGWHGYYQFTGLCSGTYVVESVPPAGYRPTKSDVGRNDSIDSDGTQARVVLSRDSSTNQTVDFGYVMDSKPGCGTPGYWKNHPESWPVCKITIGGVTYSKSKAISLMKACSDKDKTYSMFDALVSAKLNVLIGNRSECIDGTIAAADAWMGKYGPVGSGVRAGSSCSPWKSGESLFLKLDAYNNGLLCAPSRDASKGGCGGKR